MPLSQQFIEKLIFMKLNSTTRFTQDSPVYPDVWMEYFLNAGNLKTFRCDLILTPHNDSSAAELFMILNYKGSGLQYENKKNWQMASSGESVVAALTFHEMITIALPLTKWWHNYLWKGNKATPDQLWLIDIVGAILYAGENRESDNNNDNDIEKLRKIFSQLVKSAFGNLKPTKDKIALWSLSKNRPASISIERSVPCTKADASRRVFGIDGSGIAWAVLDTGIDAQHLAFRKKDLTKGKAYTKPFSGNKNEIVNNTRIAGTYDFTNFREKLAQIHENKNGVKPKPFIKKAVKNDAVGLTEVEINDYFTEIESDLRGGRMLDWTILSPLLQIPHTTTGYKPPLHPHGTHVAGILGAGMQDNDEDSLVGMCPGIELFDIRVLDDSGAGKEFNILAAMQFLRWLNSQKDGLIIHGANLSFSMIHAVDSYGCGQTPVCISSERLVSDGMVIIAAAGNNGQAIYKSPNGVSEQGFRMVNISDPGNAEEVITVGSTHRSRPHTYGVSYFSSKGPTGDGRIKPDIVAPGEKIVSAGLTELTARMDGTSMAAPHVSGAAALLLARNKELIGRPRKVKEILCKTATDLGRERYFQGCGMVDVLRAIESV